MARITKDPEARKKEFIEAARELFMEKDLNRPLSAISPADWVCPMDPSFTTSNQKMM